MSELEDEEMEAIRGLTQNILAARGVKPESGSWAEPDEMFVIEDEKYSNTIPLIILFCVIAGMSFLVYLMVHS